KAVQPTEICARACQSSGTPPTRAGGGARVVVVPASASTRSVHRGYATSGVSPRPYTSSLAAIHSNTTCTRCLYGSFCSSSTWFHIQSGCTPESSTILSVCSGHSVAYVEQSSVPYDSPWIEICSTPSA